MQLAMHNLVLVFGGSLYYAVKETEWGGYTEVSNSRRNTILRIDFTASFIHGLVAFTIPRYALFMVILY